MVTWPGAPLRAGPLGPNLALASCVAKRQSCTLSGPPEPAVDSGPPAALSQGPGTGAASGGCCPWPMPEPGHPCPSPLAGWLAWDGSATSPFSGHSRLGSHLQEPRSGDAGRRGPLSSPDPLPSPEAQGPCLFGVHSTESLYPGPTGRLVSAAGGGASDP